MPWVLDPPEGLIVTANQAVTASRGLKVDVAPFAMPKGGGLQIRLGF